MRISDWSSDVCSSDLPPAYRTAAGAGSDDADAGGFGAGVVPRLPRLPSRRAAAGPGRSEGVFRNAGDVAPLTPPSRLREGRQACTHPPPPLCPLDRSEEHPSELPSLIRTSFALFRFTNKT